MLHRKAIKHAKGNSLYSMQVYAPDFNFKDLILQTVFEKWAAMEVTELSAIPDGMEPYTLAGGLYAVFDYKGTPQDFAPMYQYIFHEWLPQSDYELDGREHFELLGERYKNNDPDSEEEIWIPIRLK
jgi:AraC family transcriptional regulator